MTFPFMYQEFLTVIGLLDRQLLVQFESFFFLIKFYCVLFLNVCL